MVVISPVSESIVPVTVAVCDPKSVLFVPVNVALVLVQDVFVYVQLFKLFGMNGPHGPFAPAAEFAVIAPE